MSENTHAAPAPEVDGHVLPSAAPAIDPGLTLCLSGGGFRATLFHLGSLRRLNELGVLANLKVISSVSGGSILNGILATRWGSLKLGTDGVFSNFNEVVGDAVRKFCSQDLRTRLLLGTRLNPFNLPRLLRDYLSVRANFLAEAYDPTMKRMRLADLPADQESPRFVFCATNEQTGACWHFHGGPRGRMGDFYTGYRDVGEVKVSAAVAASSAFPPGFGALRLMLGVDLPWSRLDPWGVPRQESPKRRSLGARGRRHVILGDGGIYDNLGVEPVWGRSQTLLVSDAGMPFASVLDVRQHIISRLYRSYEIAGAQVAAVRTRWLVDSYQLGAKIEAMVKADPRLDAESLFENIPVRQGVIWQINTRLSSFPPLKPPKPAVQGYGRELLDLFSEFRTDLNSFSTAEQACLENHGYSLADAALRSRAANLCLANPQDFTWPHKDWKTDDAARQAIQSSGHLDIASDIWRFLFQDSARGDQTE